MALGRSLVDGLFLRSGWGVGGLCFLTILAKETALVHTDKGCSHRHKG